MTQRQVVGGVAAILLLLVGIPGLMGALNGEGREVSKIAQSALPYPILAHRTALVPGEPLSRKALSKLDRERPGFYSYPRTSRAEWVTTTMAENGLISGEKDLVVFTRSGVVKAVIVFANPSRTRFSKPVTPGMETHQLRRVVEGVRAAPASYRRQIGSEGLYLQSGGAVAYFLFDREGCDVYRDYTGAFVFASADTASLRQVGNFFSPASCP